MASALASDGLLLPGWGWRPDDLRRRGGDAMVPAAQVERRRASSKMMASRSEQVTRAEPSASRLFARHPQGKTDPPPWVLRRGRGFRLTELFLHLVFLLEIGWLALCVLRNRPAIAAIGQPSGQDDFAALLVMLPVLAVVLASVSYAAGIGGRVICRTLLPADPLQSKKTRAKFQSVAWQLAVHIGFTVFELRYVLTASDREDSLSWQHEVWSPLSSTYQGWQAVLPPPHRQPNKPALRWLYLCQLAVWIVTTTCHVVIFERQSDYLVMYAHHIVTIGLVGLSYQYNYVRFGAAVLLLHDASDILVDLMKLANYLRLEGKKFMWLTEVLFGLNLCTWTYFRLFVLPVRVIVHGTLPFLWWFWPWAEGGVRRSCPGGDDGPPGDLCAEELAQHRSAVTLWTSIVVGNMLLLLLFLLHLYWTWLLLRILHGVLTVGAHTTACSEYEGASSEDDEGSQEIDGPSNTKICVGGAVVVGNMVTRGLTGKKDHAN